MLAIAPFSFYTLSLHPMPPVRNPVAMPQNYNYNANEPMHAGGSPFHVHPCPIPNHPIREETKCLKKENPGTCIK
jgi:hypothetical protein